MKKINRECAIWIVAATCLLLVASPEYLHLQALMPNSLGRAISLGVLTCVVMMAYPSHWKLVALASIFGSFAIELLHPLSHTRHAQVEDAVIAATGGLVGIFISLAVCELLKRVNTYRQYASKQSALKKFIASNSIKQLPVTSRMIESIYFSQQNGQLMIRLCNGHDRLFNGVTEDDANAISTAASPGNYYLTQIKSRYKRAA